MSVLHRLPLLALVGCVGAVDAPDVQTMPATLDLGAVVVGETAVGELALVNQGSAIARIGAISLAHGPSEGWSLLSTDTTDLFPRATSRIQVAYTPTVEGASLTRLEIRSDDPDHPVLEVPLMAEGVGANDTGNVGEPAIDDDADGYTEADGDCDDGDPTVHPDADEACDGVDRDCSGVVDDLDTDGDGHSPCDLGGDCDDADPAAYPLVVAVAAADAPDGTVGAPYGTVAEALGHLDAVCRTLVLLPGTHTASVSVVDGPLTVRGAGDYVTEVIVTPPTGARGFAVGPDGQLTLERLTVQGARPAKVDGGAVYVEHGSATLNNVRVMDNQSSEDGGAIALEGGSLALSACVLEGNVAGEDGGALAASDAVVTDVGSRWTGNTASNGGASSIRDSDLTVDASTFEDNGADGSGGALRLRGGTVALERATFQGNAAGWRGGALSVEDDTGGTLRNLLVLGNRTDRDGGGLAVTGTPQGLVVANNTLVGNDAASRGGGLFVELDHAEWGDDDDDASVYVGSNIVAWSGGTSGVWSAPDADISVVYTLGYGNAGTDLDLGVGSDAGGNLVGDPLFESFTNDGDPTNDRFTPDPSSPAVDAGPSNGEGPWGYQHWADADGSRNDRGYTGGPGAG